LSVSADALAAGNCADGIMVVVDGTRARVAWSAGSSNAASETTDMLAIRSQIESVGQKAARCHSEPRQQRQENRRPARRVVGQLLPVPQRGENTTGMLCSMIPELVDGRLPPGEWTASWSEIESAFATSDWRVHLLGGCRRALQSLKVAGCRRAWIDGSFVTSKLHPGDIDGCYDPVGVDRAALHPALRDLSPGRPAQKAEFGCEFFPNVVEVGSGEYFVEFFQRDRDGERKGIIAIDLEVFES
jgi:hypothetical protein